MDKAMDRPVLLFAYGTLQKKEIQIANFGRELTGRANALPGYRRRALILDDPKIIACVSKNHGARE
jgi:hypothetical protein